MAYCEHTTDLMEMEVTWFQGCFLHRELKGLSKFHISGFYIAFSRRTLSVYMYYIYNILYMYVCIVIHTYIYIYDTIKYIVSPSKPHISCLKHEKNKTLGAIHVPKSCNSLRAIHVLFFQCAIFLEVSITFRIGRLS